MIKTLAIILITLVLPFSAFAIDGEYKITRGEGAEGSQYGGNVSIKKVGEVYRLSWQIEKTGEQYKGVGILTDGVLSVAWGAGAVVGVVSYKVEGKKLVGTWGTPTSTSVGHETLELK